MLLDDEEQSPRLGMMVKSKRLNVTANVGCETGPPANYIAVTLGISRSVPFSGVSGRDVRQKDSVAISVQNIHQLRISSRKILHV